MHGGTVKGIPTPHHATPRHATPPHPCHPAAIDEVRTRGESCGGEVTCVVRNCPKGLGTPVFDKLEAELAKAIMSLPATKVRDGVLLSSSSSSLLLFSWGGGGGGRCHSWQHVPIEHTSGATCTCTLIAACPLETHLRGHVHMQNTTPRLPKDLSHPPGPPLPSAPLPSLSTPSTHPLTQAPHPAPHSRALRSAAASAGAASWAASTTMSTS